MKVIMIHWTFCNRIAVNTIKLRMEMDGSNTKVLWSLIGLKR